MYEKSRRLLLDAKTTEDYVILTELLIRSHTFFSQSCSMEGIANVLQTSKLCATQLERAKEFNIMIRLLTGIGHYNEMTYIMDYLWSNHQFEMLFGKGIGKVALNYLFKKFTQIPLFYFNTPLTYVYYTPLIYFSIGLQIYSTL